MRQGRTEGEISLERGTCQESHHWFHCRLHNSESLGSVLHFRRHQATWRRRRVVGTSPSPARSDLSVCSAGSQTEASRHQRLFITAESVQRLNGNSVVLTSESLIFFFFFLLLLWRILLYLLPPLPRNIRMCKWCPLPGQIMQFFLPSWWLNLSRVISMKAAVDDQRSQRMNFRWPPDFFSSAIIIVFEFLLVSRTLRDFKMALQTSH